MSMLGMLIKTWSKREVSRHLLNLFCQSVALPFAGFDVGS